MLKTSASCLALALYGVAYLGAAKPPAVAAPKAAATALEQRALLDKYCVGCHNDRQKIGSLTLEKLDLADVGASADALEKVVRKLRSGAMPPAGMPRPEKPAQDAFVAWLEGELDRHGAANPNPGRPAVHRLNRGEYTNAIRDLLALDIDGASMLPADTQGFGFDNIADVLSVSPGLLERYMIAAQKISRLAIGDPSLKTTIQNYNLPYLTLTQDDRMSDDLPAGSRGGVALKHYFPLDGEYVMRLKLQKAYLATNPRGLADAEQIDVRLDGARVKVFTVGGTAKVDVTRNQQETQAIDLSPRAVRSTDRDNNVKEPAARQPQSQERFGVPDKPADADLELRFRTSAGTHVIGVSFQKRTWATEGVGPSRLPASSFGNASGNNTDLQHGKIEMGLDLVQVEGPFQSKSPEDTPSRRRIFVCQPGGQTPAEDACARTIVSTLARRAFRRPVADRDLTELMALYADGRKAGNFESGIQRALETILTDPEFLFRVERDAPGAKPGSAYRLTDLELASRLSFFLWSSIPDDELLDAAAKGRLKSPLVLEAQVKRMLADPRSAALVGNFFGQWLYTRNMTAVRPDPKANPDFDENLRAAFLRETELFLASQLRDDRPVLDLLRANYTYLNERLARHYDIPNVYGPHFRRVTFADDRRGGILGQGSLLTVTSMSDRTSPVKRGAWILENLLGAPPPPPPANVPPLENTPIKGTLRQRMELHRKNPVCAGCHAKMDPLGFALENFDPVGRWRDTDAKAPVDAAGALPDGTPFKTPAEFRSALLHNSDIFAMTVTEKLLTYSLGRGVEHYDKPSVRRIVREAQAGGYRWSALILSIVRSQPFQMRRAQS